MQLLSNFDAVARPSIAAATQTWGRSPRAAAHSSFYNMQLAQLSQLPLPQTPGRSVPGTPRSAASYVPYGCGVGKELLINC